MLKAIVHASELITGAEIRRKQGRNLNVQDLVRIKDGAIVYGPRTIEWVGPTRSLPSRWKKIPTQNLKQERIVIPGLIDCHTHLVFGGDRSEEFAARCAGATYEEIARKGGGILSTVNATREASPRELLESASSRLCQMAAFGVRTIEVKSGYGLSFRSEVKILQVVQALQKKFPELTLVPTFLGAHAIPHDSNREKYIEEITGKMLPWIAKKSLAQACDVFVDRGYFTVQEGRKILEKARSLGMGVKIHADELADTGSTSLAVETNSLSADHLLKISKKNITQIARSETVAVLLPGTAFYLKEQHAPARALLDAGARVALATDFNPGTCMCPSLPVIMTIAALYLEMNAAEIFSAVTVNAAHALGLSARKGTLEPGMDSDIAVLQFKKFEEIYYQFGWVPIN